MGGVHFVMNIKYGRFGGFTEKKNVDNSQPAETVANVSRKTIPKQQRLETLFQNTVLIDKISFMFIV